MKITIISVLIVLLIFLCAMVGEYAQKECEKSNGKWIVINGAGYGNTHYKCIK